MDHDDKDGIATIRNRYEQRTRSISLVGFTALIVVTVVIATFVVVYV